MNGGLRKLNDYLLAGAGVIGLMATGAPEAKAQQNLQQIQAQIDQMQATIKALQKQVEEAKAQATAAKSAAANSGGPSDIDLQVKWKGAPEFSSKDGKFKMKVRGRLEADYEKADQNTRITGFPDLSATEFRRARLGDEGILWYDYKYVFEIDFANDVVRVKDAYLQYQGFRLADNPVLFRIGNFKTFNTFQDETSDRFVDNMERAAFINAWDIDRQIGFGTMYYAKHFGLAGGVFGERAPSNQDQPLFPGFTGDEDLTLAGRAFVSPIRSSRPASGRGRLRERLGHPRTRARRPSRARRVRAPCRRFADSCRVVRAARTVAVDEIDQAAADAADRGDVELHRAGMRLDAPGTELGGPLVGERGVLDAKGDRRA